MTATENALADLIASVTPTSATDEARAWERLDSLTKPPRSLGRLEVIAAHMARIQGSDHPDANSKAILLMAGDHGVVAEGVAPYPQEVTWQMVANIAAGGAAINQIAASVGASVAVFDVGVARDLAGVPGVVPRNISRGTRNMALGPAMTREECARAVLVGADAAGEAASDGARLISTGEMGIGNSTAAAALTCAFVGVEPGRASGRGTGLDDDGVRHKAAVIERALAVNEVESLDPLARLAAVGGLEIAALVGVIIGAARSKVAVIADGFISGSALLAAIEICPMVREYAMPSHVSVEPGHRIIFDHLGMAPLLDLDMRLGEGTGAALAMGIVDAACRMMSGMATFAEAGVAEATQGGE